MKAEQADAVKPTPKQIELPLRVAVCAWCHPRELGDRLGAISHGICPRHFRQVLQELRAASRSTAVNAPVSWARKTLPSVQAELAPLAAAR